MLLPWGMVCGGSFEAHSFTRYLQYVLQLKARFAKSAQPVLTAATQDVALAEILPSQLDCYFEITLKISQSFPYRDAKPKATDSRMCLAQARQRNCILETRLGTWSSMPVSLQILSSVFERCSSAYARFSNQIVRSFDKHIRPKVQVAPVTAMAEIESKHLTISCSLQFLSICK